MGNVVAIFLLDAAEAFVADQGSLDVVGTRVLLVLMPAAQAIQLSVGRILRSVVSTHPG